MWYQDLFTFCLEIVILSIVAIFFGKCARKFQQPAVLGELIGGIVLGPTILGSCLPEIYAQVFSSSLFANQAREEVVKYALLLFLFVSGMELNFQNLFSQARSIAAVSALGIAIPFLVGILAVSLVPSLWGAPAVEHLSAFSFFLATALSISALPVIARILMDMKLLRTNLGSVVIASATINDLCGWALFSIILKCFAPGPISGIHAITIFSAFFGGIIFALVFQKSAQMRETIGQFVIRYVAPLYFVSVGLKANFIANFDWFLVLMVFLIACVGKVTGATLGALLGKMPLKESLAVGFAMNARGAMEIVLATVALESKLIDERIFVALFIMALGTSMLSGPMIKWFLKKSDYVLN